MMKFFFKTNKYRKGKNSFCIQVKKIVLIFSMSSIGNELSKNMFLYR